MLNSNMCLGLHLKRVKVEALKICRFRFFSMVRHLVYNVQSKCQVRSE
jgi:hypothetical protein